MKTAIVALNRTGLELARRLQSEIASAAVHGLAGRADGADVPFTDTTGHLRTLFDDRTAIIGVCASGILIRALAPVLGDKRDEPPVVALAEDGSVAIPLLGGHSGANRLARRIAELLGGNAAVTTAGDLGLGFALDEPPDGWVVANPRNAKPLATGLLSDVRVRLSIDAGDGSWPDPERFSDNGDLTLLVTDRADCADDNTLVVHPPVLAIGVGCERGVDAAELQGLVEESLAEANLAAGAVAAVASLDLKSDEEAVLATAERLNVPSRYFTAAELEAEASRLANPSETVFREVGCHGVAEGAALALAGPDAVLIVPKRKSGRATCAIARSRLPIDAKARGRARGRLSIVGIGPGSGEWRTPEATNVLVMADEVVGYGLYLDLVAGLIEGKPRHGSELGEEETRARIALDLAAEGKSVALVCSGDPGIYALATLVFELLDREGRADWNRVEVKVVPGISALQAAAARAGGPLGHDFCAISLSDLLTPRETILKRLQAAADGDFVVALYNPQSRRRRDLVAEAKRIMLASRPAETPVVIARNLGRPGERVFVTALAEFEVDCVDMLTVVLIGSSLTRSFVAGHKRRTYTPRGYAKKMTQQGHSEDER